MQLNYHCYAVLILLSLARLLSAFFGEMKISLHSVETSKYKKSQHKQIQFLLQPGVSMNMKKVLLDVSRSEIPETITELSKVARRPKNFNLIKSCLSNYKKVHGDMLVPYNFIVPDDTIDWPEATWHIKLGKISCTYLYIRIFYKCIHISIYLHIYTCIYIYI